ncbi:hypothetical protein M3Y99_01771600 [Aphelenchoides fujianensis]|nr:hypothetical protein M3Y99_01771600 [Aphelenchoides fujianensis]
MSFAFFQKHWAVEPIAEHINFWNPFKKYRPQAGQSEVPYDPERYTIKMVDAFVMPNCYDDKAIERDNRPLNPMHEFEQGKFHDSIFEFLHTLQIRKPTPIQQFVIPYILENGPRCNYRISAKNGSGKTFAYLLPILDLIVRHAVMAETADFETRTSKSCPFAVIVMPNPQLCVQFKNLLDHFRIDGKRLGICMLLPGARLRLTDDRLPGCKIVIGTLGMISSHFFPPPNQEVFFRTTRLKYVVIDDLSDNLRVEAAELFKVCRTLSCGLIVVDSDLPTPAGSFENMLGTQSYELVMNSHFHLSNIQHLLVEVEAEEKTVALLDVLWNSIYGAKYTPKVMVFVDNLHNRKGLGGDHHAKVCATGQNR